MYFLHYSPCIESKNIMLREFLAADVQRIIGIRPIRTMLQQVPCPAHWHRLVNQRTCPSDPLGSAYKIEGLIPSNSSGLEKRQALKISGLNFPEFEGIKNKAALDRFVISVGQGRVPCPICVVISLRFLHSPYQSWLLRWCLAWQRTKRCHLLILQCREPFRQEHRSWLSRCCRDRRWWWNLLPSGWRCHALLLIQYHRRLR